MVKEHKDSLSMSRGMLVLSTAFYISTFDNIKFWTEVSTRMSLKSLSGVGYAMSFSALHVFILCCFLIFFCQGKLLKPVLVFTLILAATLGYFNQQLGVVFDSEMIRNIAETARDQNTQEAMELLSASLFRHVFIFGLIPSLLVMATRVKPVNFLPGLLYSAVQLAAIALVTVSLLMLNFKHVTFFSRENRDLRVFINPVYPIMEAKKYLSSQFESIPDTFTVVGNDAIQVKESRKRTVGIVMVGETARADHFSLNGYPRETNPQLQKRGVVNFTNAQSCGTSTAYSVPCMFSFLNQDNYTPEKAVSRSNALDVLKKAGVAVVWIDNNSSCKDVCNRIETHNLHGNEDVQSPHYANGEYYDEILLEHVDQYLNKTTSDVLLVMHMLGSHGPTYHKRYPPDFAQFKPYCQSSSPQECSTEEVVNAYDNTILYTDHVLAGLIDKLSNDYSDDSTFLFYASDHGESLGENGVYLHGLPKFIAPAAQTHVPVVAWFSATFTDTWPTPTQLTSSNVTRAISHDHISSTLLSLFEVQSEVLNPQLLLFTTDHGNVNPSLITMIPQQQN